MNISTGGAASVITTGAMLSGGATTFSNSAVLSGMNPGSIVMTLGGTIESTGNVTINGTTGGNATLIVMSGTTTSATGSVAIVSNGSVPGDTFALTTTGTVSGGSIAVQGSTGDTNTFDIGGVLNGVTIDVSAAGDAVTSTFDVTGTLTATGGATFASGTGADAFVVTPSAATVFSFAFGAGANTLQIATALANILQANPAFAGPIVFTAGSGFGTWLDLGGVVTVTPTAP
jgi:hypothetical protein